MAKVRFENIRKVYDNGFVAVHGVDLEIAEGELLVLVGPSGCGKSTTLRMVAGLESITHGRLWIGDRVVNDVPPKDRDIAMVFQSYALYPHMTVRNNLAFALKLRKLHRRVVEERVERAAEILGLTALLERRPRELSGGQRQRVALGRAIVRDPQVFLFDEPLSNLDAKLRVEMRREILRLHRQLGTTTIYVTHDQTEAMTMGDRIVVMRDGAVQQVDTPLRLYDHPVNQFVAGFIGSPAMNFVRGTLSHDGGLAFRAEGGDFVLPLAAEHRRGLGDREGGEVVLGVRPEDISVGPAEGERGVTVTLTLDVVETMGNELFLHARSPAHELVARVPPQPLPPAGEPISLTFAVDRVHLFDAITGAAIGAGE